MLRAARLAILAIALSAATGLVAAQTVQRRVAPGIVLAQTRTPTRAGSVVATVLRLDLAVSGLRVECALGQDRVMADDATRGRETLAPLALRHRAVAAINADYFPFTGDPLGLAVRDGELLSESMPHRAVVGITRDRRVLFGNVLTVGTIATAGGETSGLDGVNRLPVDDEITLLTPAYGAFLAPQAAAGCLVVPLAGIAGRLGVGAAAPARAGPGAPVATGDTLSAPDGGALLVARGAGARWLREQVPADAPVTLRLDLTPVSLTTPPARGAWASRAAALRGRVARTPWSDVVQAVSGGPWLVRQGKVAVDGAEEGFDEASFVAARHPRTAVGVTARGELLLVVVDGRQPQSAGMSLPRLAEFLLGLGAVDAINLDGGGSTAMVVRGLYVNAPSDGEPRAIANALLVLADVPPQDGPDAEGPAITLTAGESAALPAPAADGSGDVIWGTLDGRGFVDQSGRILARRAGSGAACAAGASGRTLYPLEVRPGRPARLTVARSAVANNPPDRTGIVARVVDPFGNPVAGVEVRVAARGGSPDPMVGITGPDGRVEFEVVWDAADGRIGTVSAAGLPPAALPAK